MTIQRKLTALEKRIKDLPCKAHHVVWPHEVRAGRYDDGTPRIPCTCDTPVIVMDIIPEPKQVPQIHL